jgi:hypothetical protein
MPGASPCNASIITRDEVSHPSLLEWLYCNRTATGLVRTGTQWTKRLGQIIENRVNRRDNRTQQDGLERAQANS